MPTLRFSDSHFRLKALTASQTAFLVSLLTLGAIAVDHLFVPVLFSSSPLWATAAFLMLVWRRGESAFPLDSKHGTVGLSLFRIILFAAAHLVLIIAVRSLTATLLPIAGTLSSAGWVLAALKLSVVAPTILLLSATRWRDLLHRYPTEFAAALVVLFTFFPGRVLDSLWPWYGQLLGRSVFYLAKIFVPSLIFIRSLTPTLSGPALDVTILPACSGINGVELFDYLFSFVAFLDWNRLRKRRTLFAYFGGLAAILIGNALRITSFVVFGNRGFANIVARFHISAGWVFFSLVFIVYLSIIYRRLIVREKTDSMAMH